MTYGWAILIVALSLVVLYSLGIMNPKNFIPRAPPGSCFVFRPNGPGTTDFISLQGTCGYLPMYVASFDGVNGYAQAYFNTIRSSFTFNLWAKFKRYGQNTFLFVYNNSALRFNTQNFTTSGPLEFQLYGTNDTGSINGFLLTDVIPFDKWSNIIIQFDSNNKRWYIWVNNILKGNVSNPWSSSYFTLNTIRIGGPTTWSVLPTNGSIANVQIYNTVLTQQEIQYLYQQGLGGGPVRLQNLVAWWPLNGDAKDYSGNNNHGTIYGGVTFVQNYNPP